MRACWHRRRWQSASRRSRRWRREAYWAPSGAGARLAGQLARVARASRSFSSPAAERKAWLRSLDWASSRLAICLTSVLLRDSIGGRAARRSRARSSSGRASLLTPVGRGGGRRHRGRGRGGRSRRSMRSFAAANGRLDCEQRPERIVFGHWVERRAHREEVVVIRDAAGGV